MWPPCPIGKNEVFNINCVALYYEKGVSGNAQISRQDLLLSSQKRGSISFAAFQRPLNWSMKLNSISAKKEALVDK